MYDDLHSVLPTSSNVPSLKYFVQKCFPEREIAHTEIFKFSETEVVFLKYPKKKNLNLIGTFFSS